MNPEESVEVLLDHPQGAVWVSLEDRKQQGPGPRPLLRPVAARDRRTGTRLPLSVVPFRFCNTALTRFFVRSGWMKSPWL